MTYSVEDVSTVKKIIHVEVPATQVTSALDKAYGELKRTAKIKGFRPGKAPRSVLERHYGKDVQADVGGQLIQESFAEAATEADLRILGRPEIDPPAVVPGEAFAYDATIEVPPEIADIDFKGLTLTKTIYSVTDEEIEAQLTMIQQKLAERKPLTEPRPLAEDDFALVDYEGFDGDQPHPDVEKKENFLLKIGTGPYTKAFDDALVGMSAGESKSVTLTLPDDFYEDALKGATVTFQVKVNEIHEEVLPEMNDELAKKLGKYETLEEVREAIIENLGTGYAKRTEQEINEQVFTALIEKTEFELPDVLVRMELDGIIQEALRSFSYHNVDPEQIGMTESVMAEKYRDVAEKQVRRHLILERIIEQESMEVAEDSMAEAFEEMATTYQQPVDQIQAFYRQSPDKLEAFKHALLEKQALQLIIENGMVEEVSAETESADENESPAGA